jgi:hypothetical protein
VAGEGQQVLVLLADVEGLSAPAVAGCHRGCLLRGILWGRIVCHDMRGDSQV